MRNQQLLRQNGSRVHLLLLLIVLFVLWHQCQANEFERKQPCRPGSASIPKNCPLGYYINESRDDCFEYLCYRDTGEFCYENDPETKCRKGQTCKCNECMNCTDITCYLRLCPAYAQQKKRLPGRVAPWYQRDRWQSLAQRYIDTTKYED